MNLTQPLLRYFMGAPPRRFDSETSIHWVPISDGVRLATTVIQPRAAGAQEIPTLLIRTPRALRGAPGAGHWFARLLAESGYTVVVQTCRGRYDSEGRFAAFEHEARDGEETLAWIADQPWGRGPLALVGLGYSGFAAWAAAAACPQQTAALVVGFHAREPRAALYAGDAFRLEDALHLGATLGAREAAPSTRVDFTRALDFRPVRGADRVALRSVDAFGDWTAHPGNDAWWQALVPEIPMPPPPTLLITGWRTSALAPQLEDYAALRRAADAAGTPAPELLVAPWLGHRAFRGRSRRGLIVRNVLDFLDRTLLGAPARAASVRVFHHGPDQWLELGDWPPPDATAHTLHLRSEGQANGLVGDGGLSREVPPENEPPDRFVCDPEDPVPSTDPGGPEDQRPVEARSDVLCYTTPPLEEDLDVVGDVRLTLFAESNASDGDFTAKLVDVAPDGTALACCEGIVRARWQGGGDVPRWFRSDTPRSFDIDLGATAVRFRAGHRIRLEVASANFPRFDRNPNTCAEPESAAPEDFSPARRTVRHDVAHPSRLTLRILEIRADGPK